MSSRIREWLARTHGTSFELLRHFLVRFFDTETSRDPSDALKVALGIVAALLSASILALKTYMERYDGLSRTTESMYRASVREDMLLLIVITMAVIALLTALRWEYLFPSARDCLALAAYPVSPRQIFAAKFECVLIVFTTVLVALCGAPAFLFAWVASGKWQSGSIARNAAANFTAAAGAGVFVFFGLLAIYATVLATVPRRRYSSVLQSVQALVLIGSIGALPLIGRQPQQAWWWPPVWFLKLRDGLLSGTGEGWLALCAITAAISIAVLAFLCGYSKYLALLVEGDCEGYSGRRGRIGAWLLDRWIRDPREQAVFSFCTKTLARSGGHRLLLLAYVGLALGWALRVALDAPRPSLKDQGMYGLVTVLVPLSAAILATVALRTLYSMPVSLSCRWIFQLNDQAGAGSWLRAVERSVVYLGIVPLYALALPATVAILGVIRGAAAILLGFAASLAFFEFLFRRWRKMPFTCLRAASQTPVALRLLQYAFLIPLLGAAGTLILTCSGQPLPFIALSTFEAALWFVLRKRRLSFWATAQIEYEELSNDTLETLPELIAEAPLEVNVTNHGPRDMFSGNLVASRGWIPRDWAEEIDEDRRSPREWIATLFADLRYGFRLIRRSPALSAAVVLTLTVGIGINCTVFTIVDGLALRPHVYKDPDTFLRIVPEPPGGSAPRLVSYAEYTGLRDQSRSVRHLAAYSPLMAMIGDDDPSGSIGLLVSCNFFQVDGLDRAVFGRLIVPEDCSGVGQAPVGVISESVWRGRFGSDPSLIGRRLSVNNRPVLIVGVVPDRTSGWTIPSTIWIPYTAQPYFEPGENGFTREDMFWLSLAGRLAPGYSRRSAEAEMETLERLEDRSHPGRRTVVTTTNGSWAWELALNVSGQRLMLVAFFIGSFFQVLILACANAGTLLLCRAASRQKEIAVRLSLGASRVRLVRMLLAESLALATVAGLISVYLVNRAPEPLYRLVVPAGPLFPMRPDWKIFMYTAGIVLFTGVLSGIAPALDSLKVDLASSLKGYGSLLAPVVGGPRIRGALVAMQISFSMTLLVAAALFARAEQTNLHSDPGYLPRRVVIAALPFPEGVAHDAIRARIDHIVQRVKSLPGVQSVAFSDELPLWSTTTVELQPPERPDASQPVDLYTASPGFFETLGIPIVHGREFRESDASGVVISESLAWALWGRRNPIGQELPLPSGRVPVIGVSRDVEPMRFGGSDNPAVYQLRRLKDRNIMSVRFAAGAPATGPAVRAAIREADHEVMVFALQMQDWIERTTAVLWHMVNFIVVLALVGMTLAIVGVYGAVSFSVNQRRREFGIRLALGASRLNIVSSVLWSSGRPVALGLLTGLWISTATSAALRQSLNGSPIRLDTSAVWVYAAVAALLATTAIAGMFGPAIRGSQADPCEALRCE